MNNTALPVHYNNSPSCISPTVAIVGIITIGVCFCTCIVTNAKYNRDTELTYKDFSLKSQKCQPDIIVPCSEETV